MIAKKASQRLPALGGKLALETAPVLSRRRRIALAAIFGTHRLSIGMSVDRMRTSIRA
ncbi:MAG TPA: hypothetical protein VG308_05500 [Stellaceae bacterium]|jgi:hypothetical protein|nr:hypothetical protein [Stellaceae bacterium]